MQKSSWYDLAVIVIVGVIIADFIGGFYGPLGGGSGVIVSGITNIFKTSVNAMLGCPTSGCGPNNPGSQKTPAPKAVPPPKPKPKKSCFTLFGVCVPFTGG